MSVSTRAILKTYFETGDFPTAAQFIELIDSLKHLDDIEVADLVARYFRPKDNLLDPSQSLIDHYINWNVGLPSANASYDSSEYIKVEPSTDYFGNHAHYAWFDKHQKYISGSNAGGLLSSPVNAAFIRVSYAGSTPYFIQSSVAGAYTPYKLVSDVFQIAAADIDGVIQAAQTNGLRSTDTPILAQDTSFFEAGKNLFDKTEYTDDRYVNWDNGVLSANASYWATGYMAVIGGMQYTANTGQHYAWYDVDKNYISGANGITFPLTAPPAARFIRVSVVGGFSIDAYQFEQNTVNTAYEPYTLLLSLDAIQSWLNDYRLKTDKVTAEDLDFLSRGTNLYIDETSTEGFYINWDVGLPSANPSYRVSDFIPVLPNEDYHYNIGSHYAIFDSDKNYISGTSGANVISMPANVGFVRISVPIGATTAQFELGNTATAYQKGVYSFPAYLEVGSIEKPEIVLPDEFVAVVGTPLQLFYHGLITSLAPYKYNIVVNCARGKAFPRYFEYTPTGADVGSFAFSLSIYNDNDVLVGAAATSIRVVDFIQAPTAQKNVLTIGDSLNNNSGDWGGLLAQQVVDGTDVLSGLSAITNIDFVGEYGTLGREYTGQGGWNWANYNSAPDPTTADVWVYLTHDKDNSDQHSIWTDSNNNDWRLETIDSNRLKFTREGHTALLPAANDTLAHSANAIHTAAINYTSTQTADQNPFYDNVTNQVDLSTWFANKYPAKDTAGEEIDVCFALFGWNGGHFGKPNAADWGAYIVTARTFLDSLHTAYPNCKVYVMGVQYPSLNGGLGANYGARSNYYSEAWSVVRSVQGLNKAYQILCNEAAYSSFCTFVNVSGQFDAENNMPEVDTPVNLRNSKTEKRGNNGVHPSSEGYLQIADAAVRCVVKELCQ